MRKILVPAACILAISLQAVAQKSQPAEHWVATWGTAQQLIRVPGAPGLPGGRGPAGPTGASAAPGANTPLQPGAPAGPAPNAAPSAQGAPASPQGAAPAAPGRGTRRYSFPRPISALNNQTIRMILRTSIGGHSVRIRLANALSTTTVLIGAAHIGVRGTDSSIAAGSDRILTFSGKPTATIYAGQLLISDPVKLDVAPLTDLAVSLYIANDAGAPTIHPIGMRPVYVSGSGDFTAAASMQDLQATTMSYYWLQGVDVLAPADTGTIVTFGDSITDGDQSQPDTNHMWPAVLAARLQANPATKNLGIVNAGIAGNRITGDNISGLARLYRDALSVPGVKWITLLEGINDISFAMRQAAAAASPAATPEAAAPPSSTGTPQAAAVPAPVAPVIPFTADTLISAYGQVIEMAHMQGIKVIGCTITPNGGAPGHTDHGEEIREAVNDWIRHSGKFDAVVDFDAVTRDASDPHRFGPQADSPDMLHPGDGGYNLMANAFDLSIFTSTPHARSNTAQPSTQRVSPKP